MVRENKRDSGLVMDIKPHDGLFNVTSEIDLRNNIQPEDTFIEDIEEQHNNTVIENNEPEVDLASFSSLVDHVLEGDLHSDIRYEIENLINQNHDPIVELTRVGAVFTGSEVKREQSIKKDEYMEARLPYIRPREKVEPRTQSVPKDKMSPNLSNHDESLYQNIIEKIREPIGGKVVTTLSANQDPVGSIISEYKINLSDVKQKPRIKKIEAELTSFYTEPQVQYDLPKAKHLNFVQPRKKRFFKLWAVLLIGVGIFAYGLTLKNELVRDSNLALENLQNARQNLENFNFSGAAKNFKDSYNDFTQAGQNLNLMGASLTGIFSDLPGFDKLKSAKDIVEAGKLLASAGSEMSEALDFLSETGAILNPTNNNTKPATIIAQLRNALIKSERNLKQASTLLASIDEAIIPDDRRADFFSFRDKIPLFQDSINNSIEYTEFLESLVGIDETKKYLLLFQNNSELRPTGGFPGTYGVVSFSNGRLDNFFVDDVYNLDGQLKDNIIPPKQLQHITPTWGMRDSAWFIDFPTSAKKAMWFFSKEAGYNVDGIITVNPDVVSGILDVVGPIDMPEYGMTISSNNFLSSIQEEVEYGDNRKQPKTVVVDFAPRFLEKIYSAEPDKWIQIFNVLMAGMDEKDILMYFTKKSLESFAIKEGFGGEIKATNDDYMTVNFSNVKGSKTDAVTDSSIKIESRVEASPPSPEGFGEASKIIHKVVITRKHNGGDHEHGFYNKQNPAYVRVLIPNNAELLGIKGQDTTNFRTLVNYGIQNFTKDYDLSQFEAGFYSDNSFNIDRYNEGGLHAQTGKQGIGFWMITDPKTTKKVEFEYSVPFNGDEYSFYFQKQSGIDWKNFQFSINELGDRKILGSVPLLNKIGDLYMLDVELKTDLEIKLKLESR